ncbi:hypothetical protein FCV25MIE_29674 [Fagus crenata]
MGCIGGGGGGLSVVLDFSGVVLEFSGEGLEVSGVTVESESGREDELLEKVLRKGVCAGLGWMGCVEVLEPVRGLIGGAALLYGPCGNVCSSPTRGPRIECVEGETRV